jgi:glycerol-3-phosphate acyltransferase PlsX
MIAGVDRPALAIDDSDAHANAVLLDTGANVECRPQHLLQFAVMGSVVCASCARGGRTARGLLSIGEEESKGNELTREAHRLLKASPVRFIGNVEGRENLQWRRRRDRLRRFTGNIVAQDERRASWKPSRRFSATNCRARSRARWDTCCRGARFAAFAGALDYSEYGGAALLGVAGLVVVGHGRSSARAVRNACGHGVSVRHQ